MRISDWSSDVCSSDLRSWWRGTGPHPPHLTARAPPPCCAWSPSPVGGGSLRPPSQRPPRIFRGPAFGLAVDPRLAAALREVADARSEEHTSELQSLMRSSYAVFCLKK